MSPWLQRCIFKSKHYLIMRFYCILDKPTFIFSQTQTTKKSINKIKHHNVHYEGVLWLEFNDKCTNYPFYACVCYLPPNNFTRQIDVCDFYDTLLSNVYEYHNSGTVCICRDFNSRIGVYKNNIVGVDEIVVRDVVNFTKNSYG